MQNKKFTFFYTFQRKCIANLKTKPMHLRQDFAKYKIQKIMKEIVLIQTVELNIRLIEYETNQRIIFNLRFDAILYE